MRRKRVLILASSIFLVLVLTMLSLMTACPTPAPTQTQTQTPTPSPTPTDKVYHLKLQHAWAAVDNHCFENYADMVREMSGGRIDISVFSDGEIVTLMEAPEATAMGVLDMMHSHPYNFEASIPEAGVEGLPYLWRDLDEAQALYYQFGLEDLLRESFKEEFGIHLIGLQPDDYGTFMVTEDFTSLADLEGRRLLLWEPYASILADNFGVASTYIAPEEIYTSLALGVLDGVAWGGAKCASEMGFHEVAKYFVLPYYKPVWFPGYFINQELWDELSPDLQAILTEAVYANGKYIRSYYAEGEKRALSNMIREYGVEARYLPEEDVEQIFQITLQRLEELKTKGPRAERAANICLDALRDFGYID